MGTELTNGIITLGNEWDDKLFERLHQFLVDHGYTLVSSWQGFAGSQDISNLKYCNHGQEIVLEAETYVGITLSGDIDELQKLSNAFQTLEESARQ